MKIKMDKQEARRIAVIEQSLAGKFNNQQAAQLLDRTVSISCEVITVLSIPLKGRTEGNQIWAKNLQSYQPL